MANLTHTLSFLSLLACNSPTADSASGDSDSNEATDSGDGNTDDTGTDTAEAEFLVEESLQDSVLDENGECEYGFYWPTHTDAWPILVMELEPPPPPYEIRALTATVFSHATDGYSTTDCNAAVPLVLFAFVSDERNMDAYQPGEDALLPDLAAFAPIAQVEVAGTGTGVDWEDVETLTGVLDEPVRVETAGTLWVGAYVSDPENLDEASCPMGCVDGTLKGWQYFPTADDHWDKLGESVDLRVTVAY